jgi:hypothetical protein
MNAFFISLRAFSHYSILPRWIECRFAAMLINPSMSTKIYAICLRFLRLERVERAGERLIPFLFVLSLFRVFVIKSSLVTSIQFPTSAFRNPKSCSVSVVNEHGLILGKPHPSRLEFQFQSPLRGAQGHELSILVMPL